MDNIISDSGVSLLSDVLRANSSLTKMGLSMSLVSFSFLCPPSQHSFVNEIGDTGVALLSKALMVNSSLLSLELGVRDYSFFAFPSFSLNRDQP